MQMTKFSSNKDAGYVSVSDQLWLWVDTLQKEADAQAKAGSGLQMPAEEVREGAMGGLVQRKMLLADHNTTGLSTPAAEQFSRAI
jgi:hypothetical protein